MSDWVKVPEADWNVLNEMRDTLHRRAQEKALGEIMGILLRGADDPGETLAALAKQLRRTETLMERRFGRFTRHNCRAQFAGMLRAGFFREEEIELFTAKTRDWAAVVVDGRKAASEPPSASQVPEVQAVAQAGAQAGAQAAAAVEGRLNGFVTAEGEYVGLDDLEGMEKALARHFKGDLDAVQNGLRGASLELAKEGDDVVARLFLAHAREIGGGAAKEGPEMVRLGVAFEGIKRYDLAGECYEYGRSIGRRDQVSWYFLHNNHAYCFAMLERFAEAEPLAREAIRIEPGRHNAHKNLGLALMGQGRLAEAAESLRVASEIFPVDSRAARLLAAVEERLRSHPARQLN